MKANQPELLLNENDQGDVGAALQLLREALGEEEKRIRWEGSQAMAKGDYDTATAVLDFAKRLLAFTGKVESLGTEWQNLQDLRDEATPEVQQIVSKRFFGRIGKGEITPHQDFCRPILETLVELGGGARTKTVLDKIGLKMKGVLKPADYECHKSDAKQIRWRNTAQWARNTMVNDDGRMKQGSPNGYWEISDKGRAWLKSKSAPTSVGAASKVTAITMAHRLDEDFSFTKPTAFVLEGRRFDDVNSWQNLYELVLLRLADKNTAIFQALPETPDTRSRRGTPLFSRKPAELRKPLALPHGIHAETNLSANSICKSLRTLLGLFSIPLSACSLFTRKTSLA